MAKSMKEKKSTQKVLVIGDTRLATRILEGLLFGSLDLHQLVLPTSSAQSTAHVRIHKKFQSSEALIELFRDLQPDVIFSTQSTGSYDVQTRIIDAAIAAHVPRFVPGEFSQDCLNERIQDRLPPCRERARVIKYLEDRAAEESISWAAAATGVDLEEEIIGGSFGFDMKWHSANVLGTGDEQFAASSVEWIGKVALKMVQCWGEMENRFHYAAGMMVSAHNIVRLLENETGSRWEIGYVDVEDGAREAEGRIERGFPDAGMFLMRRSVLSDPNVGAVQPFLLQDDFKRKAGVDLTGERPEDVIKKIVHDYRHRVGGDCGCG